MHGLGRDQGIKTSIKKWVSWPRLIPMQHSNTQRQYNLPLALSRLVLFNTGNKPLKVHNPFFLFLLKHCQLPCPLKLFFVTRVINFVATSRAWPSNSVPGLYSSVHFSTYSSLPLKLVILLQFTSSTTTSLIHLTVEKLIENEFNASFFSVNCARKLPFLPNLFSFLTIGYCLCLFNVHSQPLCFQSSFQASRFRFKPSNDTLINHQYKATCRCMFQVLWQITESLAL